MGIAGGGRNLPLHTMKLHPLKKGDWIAVAAPSGPFDRARFLKGVSLLKKAGFRVAYSSAIFQRHHRLPYLAGEDLKRAKALNHALRHPRYKAVLFARGGFGCQRLLPLLKGRIRPRVVVGLSDLTVLLNFLWQRHRLLTFYGPMVAPHLTSKERVRKLVQSLTEPKFSLRHPLRAKKILNRGTAEGTLVGGCLSLIVSTLGTPWEVKTDGSLLFLEDTHEEPYAVDRMLTQLEQAGKLRRVKGILLGTFRNGKTLFPHAIETVFRERLKGFRGPVLWGLRFGHCKDPLILPIGGKARIRENQVILTRGVF